MHNRRLALGPAAIHNRRLTLAAAAIHRSEERSWEPQANLNQSRGLLDTFLAKQKGKKTAAAAEKSKSPRW
eukprot:7494017-Pyramimonas_sp.AAC.1